MKRKACLLLLLVAGVSLSNAHGVKGGSYSGSYSSSHASSSASSYSSASSGSFSTNGELGKVGGAGPFVGDSSFSTASASAKAEASASAGSFSAGAGAGAHAGAGAGAHAGAGSFGGAAIAGGSGSASAGGLTGHGAGSKTNAGAGTGGGIGIAQGENDGPSGTDKSGFGFATGSVNIFKPENSITNKGTQGGLSGCSGQGGCGSAGGSASYGGFATGSRPNSGSSSGFGPTSPPNSPNSDTFGSAIGGSIQSSAPGAGSGGGIGVAQGGTNYGGNGGAPGTDKSDFGFATGSVNIFKPGSSGTNAGTPGGSNGCTGQSGCGSADGPAPFGGFAIGTGLNSGSASPIGSTSPSNNPNFDKFGSATGGGIQSSAPGNSLPSGTVGVSGDGKFGGGYPGSYSNAVTGGKVPCCKGPFPGPKGSIYDYKPAPPGGGGPDPAWLTQPGAPVGSPGVDTYEPGVTVSSSLIHSLPGPHGSIHASRPVTGTSGAGASANLQPTQHGAGQVPNVIGNLPGPSGSIFDSKPATGTTPSTFASGSYSPNVVPGVIGVLPGPSGGIYDSKPVSGSPSVYETPGPGPVKLPSVIGSLPGPSGSIYSSKPVSGTGITPGGATYAVEGSYAHAQSGASSSQTTSSTSGSFTGPSGSIYNKPGGAVGGYTPSIPVAPLAGPVTGTTPSTFASGSYSPNFVAGGTGILPGPSGGIYDSKPVSGSPSVHQTPGPGPVKLPSVIGSLPGPSGSIYSSKPVSGTGTRPGEGTYAIEGSYAHTQSGASSSQTTSSTSGSFTVPSGSIYNSKPGGAVGGYTPSIPVAPILGPACSYTPGTKPKPSCAGGPGPSQGGSATSGNSYYPGGTAIPVHVGPAPYPSDRPTPIAGFGCKYIPGTKTKVCSGSPYPTVPVSVVGGADESGKYSGTSSPGSLTGGSAGCCGGPFPGPNRGIHDSKPVIAGAGSFGFADAGSKATSETSAGSGQFSGYTSKPFVSNPKAVAGSDSTIATSSGTSEGRLTSGNKVQTLGPGTGGLPIEESSTLSLSSQTPSGTYPGSPSTFPGASTVSETECTGNACGPKVTSGDTPVSPPTSSNDIISTPTDTTSGGKPFVSATSESNVGVVSGSGSGSKGGASQDFAIEPVYVGGSPILSSTPKYANVESTTKTGGSGSSYTSSDTSETGNTAGTASGAQAGSFGGSGASGCSFGSGCGSSGTSGSEISSGGVNSVNQPTTGTILKPVTSEGNSAASGGHAGGGCTTSAGCGSTGGSGSLGGSDASANGFATGSVSIFKPDGSSSSGPGDQGAGSAYGSSTGGPGSQPGCSSGGCGGTSNTGAFGFNAGSGHGAGTGSVGNGFGAGFAFSGSSAGSGSGVKGGSGSGAFSSAGSSASAGSGAGFGDLFNNVFGSKAAAAFSKPGYFGGSGASSGSFAKAGSYSSASSYASARAGASSSSY